VPLSLSLSWLGQRWAGAGGAYEYLMPKLPPPLPSSELFGIFRLRAVFPVLRRDFKLRHRSSRDDYFGDYFHFSGGKRPILKSSQEVPCSTPISL